MRLGKPLYFYQRYSELALHWLIGARFLRPDHTLMAVWHLWKCEDCTRTAEIITASTPPGSEPRSTLCQLTER